MRNNLDKFTMFRKSKPYGYNPADVEKKIGEYEDILRQINTKYAEKVQENNQLREKIERLENSLKEMHMEMANLEMPDTNEIVEKYVMNEFKNYNTPAENPYPTPPKEIEEQRQSENIDINYNLNNSELLNNEEQISNDNIEILGNETNGHTFSKPSYQKIGESFEDNENGFTIVG